MTFDTFKESLEENKPPKTISLALQALWWDANNDWEQAHQCAQSDNGTAGAWVHAYLHRKEGDEGNAGYWYARAGKSKSVLSLEGEWEEVVAELINA